MKDHTWKLHSSKYVFKDKWFIARADYCEMPDGTIIEPYYVLEFPNWCIVVLITENEEVVMVKQYRHAIQTTTIELPGGVIDVNENPEAAAIREVLEETGYVINNLKLLYNPHKNFMTSTPSA
jgi:8-oxo-dGTP pyrophosphatase MutT (NUDIX family)